MSPGGPEEQAGAGPVAAAPPEDPAPRVVCFDVGEVLIDETRVWAVWAELLGVSPFTLQAVIGAAVVQGEPHTSALPFVAPNIDWRSLVDEHERRYGGFRRTDLYPDAAGCLAELHDRGFGIVVAGNQPGIRRAQLLDLGLAADHVTTSDHLGAEKPDPAFFTALLDDLEGAVGTTRSHEVLYVGDRVDTDVLPALEHGLRVCWLRRGPWGRLIDLPDGVMVDLVLDGLGELPELLAAWRDGPAGADD